MSGTSPFQRAQRRPRVSLSYLRRTVRLGIRSLWMHRLRSFLTVLGIVFGVCSVIAMLAVGEGVSHEVQEQIRRLGSNNVILRSVKPVEERKAESRRTFAIEYGLTYADVDAIQSTVPGVTVVVPARVVRSYVWHIQHRVDCDITGTVTWYPKMHKSGVAKGRFFNQDEMLAVANVCVLDARMAQELFPLDEPVGATVRVGSNYYRIVGVMEPEVARAATEEIPGESSSSASAKPAGYRMYIPLSAAKSRFGETLLKRRSGSFEAEKVQLHEVTVKVENQEAVINTAAVIADLLARNHKTKDYEQIVPLALLKQAQRTKQIFSVVLGSIAAISLLVGGIGIMNIMLATVTERTREIGIRRAMGARRRDIIIQFLIETVILSCSGGLVGVVLGIIIPFAITRFSSMVTIITPSSPMIAFSISALIGVVFGLYPAFRAANMDPVEALRHE